MHCRLAGVCAGVGLLLPACASLSPEEKNLWRVAQTCADPYPGLSIRSVSKTGRVWYYYRGDNATDIDRFLACWRQRAPTARLVGASEPARGPEVSVASKKSTVVPLEVVGGALRVHASLDGIPVVMRLEPDAARTLIASEVLRRTGQVVPEDALRAVVTDAAGHMESLPLIRRSLSVGEVTVQNLSVGVTVALGADGEVDGVLGADFLDLLKSTIDRDGRRLALERR